MARLTRPDEIHDRANFLQQLPNSFGADARVSEPSGRGRPKLGVASSTARRSVGGTAQTG